MSQAVFVTKCPLCGKELEPREQVDALDRHFPNCTEVHTPRRRGRLDDPEG